MSPDLALTDAELLELVAAGESDRAEFTIATQTTDKFGEAVCAFANDFPNNRKPGYLLIGVNDDGSLNGLRATDQLLRRLGDLRSNVNLEPLVAMTVQKHSFPEGDIVVVSVLPSDRPPVRYKGRVWVRTGPSRRSANRQEERALTERQSVSDRPFDSRPCLGCTRDDLAPDLFLAGYLPQAVSREVIEENDREFVEQMASLRFYDLAADCPTNAAILMFGTDPLRWLPGSRLDFVRWGGTSMADDPIETKSFHGDLLTVLRDVESFASLPARTRPVAESALREREESDYPQVAVRELLLNAIMHRSYESNAPVRFNWFDDRIEIQSPGGLYGMASEQNFPRQTDYRNPVVAEAMATLGYVNRFGRGVIRAQDALRQNGNAEAQFCFDTSFVLVTIPGKK